MKEAMPTVYRNHSALKLVELSERFPIFHRARTVLDLAAAPGGFSQVAMEQMSLAYHHPTRRNKASCSRNARNDGLPTSVLEPMVIAVDQRGIWPLHGIHRLHQLNIQHTSLLHRCVINSLSSSTSTSPPRHSFAPSLPSAITGRSPRVVDVVLHDGVSVRSGQDSFSVAYAQNQMVLQVLRFSCELFSREADDHEPVRRSSPPSTYPRLVGRSADDAIGEAGRMADCRDTNLERGNHSSGRVPALPVFVVSKIFRSSQLDLVMEAFQTFFQHVEQYRPTATPPSSLESYVVASGFRTNYWRQYEDVKRKGTEAFKVWLQRQKKNKYGRDVFSVPPSAHDLPLGKQFVWKCVGCQELRFGSSVCPLCTLSPRR